MTMLPPKRLTMADIAALAEVSVSTVSRALSGNPLIPEAMRLHIQKIADDNGYVINHTARNLRLKSTGTIGLVLPLGHETEQKITDPFFMELIASLAEEVLRRGYDLLLSKNPSPNIGWLQNLARSHRFDGMLLLGQSDQHEAINELAKTYFPLVVWGEKMPIQTYCSVGADNTLGGYLATKHLFERGRQSLMFLGPTHVPEAHARLNGFIKAHAEIGKTVEATQILGTNFTFDNARASIASRIAVGQKFDGIVAASDVIAHGAMTVLQEANISVPKDVSVIGFDDVAFAKTLSPPLSTIRQDISAGARLMAALLNKRLQGEGTDSALIPATLIVRGST